jgi:trehalose-6-phosphate synthase
MRTAERQDRMRRMRRLVMEYNIYLWAAKALGDLRAVRLEDSDTSRPAPTLVTMPEVAAEKLA